MYYMYVHEVIHYSILHRIKTSFLHKGNIAFVYALLIPIFFETLIHLESERLSRKSFTLLPYSYFERLYLYFVIAIKCVRPPTGPRICSKIYYISVRPPKLLRPPKCVRPSTGPRICSPCRLQSTKASPVDYLEEISVACSLSLAYHVQSRGIVLSFFHNHYIFTYCDSLPICYVTNCSNILRCITQQRCIYVHCILHMVHIHFTMDIVEWRRYGGHYVIMQDIQRYGLMTVHNTFQTEWFCFVNRRSASNFKAKILL